MSFASLNKTAVETVRAGIDTQKLPFMSLKDFIGRSIEVGGFYTHKKGRFGEQLVVVGREVGKKESFYNIDFPKWAIDDFNAIKADAEQLKELLEGKLILTDIQAKTTSNGTTTIYTYTDGPATLL